MEVMQPNPQTPGRELTLVGDRIASRWEGWWGEGRGNGVASQKWPLQSRGLWRLLLGKQPSPPGLGPCVPASPLSTCGDGRPHLFLVPEPGEHTWPLGCWRGALPGAPAPPSPSRPARPPRSRAKRTEGHGEGAGLAVSRDFLLQPRVGPGAPAPGTRSWDRLSFPPEK